MSEIKYDGQPDLGSVASPQSVVPVVTEPGSPPRLPVMIFALFSAVIGLVALVGWGIERPVAAGLGSGRISVAPSTAAMLVVYALAVCQRATFPTNRALYWVGVMINGAGALVALVFLVLSVQGVRLAAEHLGFTGVDVMGEIPVGHMSPVTAGCFLLASCSYFLSLPKLRGRGWAGNLAWWLACAIMATGFTLLVAYFYGEPVLYGSAFIPPAALTSMAFISLGSGLLALAWPQARQPDSPDEVTRRTTSIFLLVFILLAAGIVIAGFLYYRNYEIHHRTELERQLSAIGNLKADELVHWRQERLADGAVLYRNRNFSELFQRYLQRPTDLETAQNLRVWLQHIQGAQQYNRVFLLDAEGREVMAAPSVQPSVSRLQIGYAAEVMRTKQVVFEDFYRNEYDGRIYLAVLVPILAEPDHDRAMGTLILRIDPGQYLYPFLQRWPTPSQSAETLLVRRDGNEVLFLNELRFQKDAALRLRFSLDHLELPAVHAVLGRQGVVEGRDYRGVPVIADVRQVPESPWALVSRMDTFEVYQPLREKLWMLVLLVGALVMGAGAGVGSAWRRQRSEFYREKFESAEALRESEEKYRLIADNADDLVYLLAPDGSVLYISPSCERLTGYGVAEFTDHPGLFVEIAHLDSREAIARHFAEVGEEVGADYLEFRILTKSGEVCWVSHNCEPVYTKEGRYAGRRGTNRNITGRKKAEEETERHLSRLRSIVDILLQDQSVSLQDFLDYALEEAIKLTASRIGYIYHYNEEHQEFVLNSWSRGVMDECTIAEKQTAYQLAKTGIWGEAVRQRKAVMVNDFQAENPLRKGYPEGHAPLHRFLTVPVFNNDRIVAVVGVANKESDYDETDTLQLTLLMNSIWKVMAKKEAEGELLRHMEELKRSNEELQQFAYVASHDLQEPLRMVSSFTQLLAQRYEGQLDERAQKYIHYAVDGAIRMQSLINDLLAYSRIGTRGKPLVPVDTHAVLGEAIRNLQMNINESQAIITNGELPEVCADGSQLVQLFQNLIGNGVKFRGRELPHIHIAARDEGAEWLFSVKDNGIGIEPEYAEKVFVIFQRLHTREEYPGSGIGLAICKKIVERHGGRIWFESTFGQGTTFYFTIPKK